MDTFCNDKAAETRVFLVNASGNCCLIWSVHFTAIITFAHIGLLCIASAMIIGM